MKWIAAVEGGGTSFRLAVCFCKDNDSDVLVVPTIAHRTEVSSSDDPTTTLKLCAVFFREHKPPQGYYDVLAIATFGPVGLDPSNTKTYGRILASSPKAQWRNVDLLTPLKEACQGSNIDKPLLCRVETDVNGPALAEFHYNKSNNNKKEETISSLAYVTVGTGVGLGLVIHGQAVHGRMHPEGGHVCVQPLEGDTFGGYSWGKDCNPYASRNTVESLASSVALTERWTASAAAAGRKIEDRNILATLDDTDEIWDHAVNALANMCVTLLLTVSVERIVLGGGLMKRRSLLPRIQKRTIELINGYLDLPKESMDDLITTSQFGDDCGLIGAMVLGQLSTGEEDAEKKSIEEKKTAFNVGLWHGTILGALLAGVLVKYMGFKRSK